MGRAINVKFDLPYEFQLQILIMQIRQGPCRKRKSQMNTKSAAFLDVFLSAYAVTQSFVWKLP